VFLVHSKKLERFASQFTFERNGEYLKNVYNNLELS
jgi:hypothetical protein